MIADTVAVSRGADTAGQLKHVSSEGKGDSKGK